MRTERERGRERGRIPEELKERLLYKISQEIFDVKEAVSLCYDENCSLHKSYAVAARDLKAYEDIYLIHHM
jgi:hypothetical protein